MVILDRLLRARGDARKILSIRDTQTIDWTHADELARPEVVRGIQFDRFKVSDAEVSLDFVECRFNQCSFSGLTTDAHLWGFGDEWIECVFERGILRQMIAPVNCFRNCRFENVTIEKFLPHQTLFDACLFSGGSIEGLKAQLISNSQVANREMTGEAGQLLFRNCRFENFAFLHSHFAGVAFQGCSFEHTGADACTFDGVVSDVTWWQAQQGDPFTAFLTEALALIRARCGPNSAAYREFESYTIDYRIGKTRDQDFSARLYNDRVPYEETQMIIKDLRKLVARFPF